VMPDPLHKSVDGIHSVFPRIYVPETNVWIAIIPSIHGALNSFF
jgi:hypothetical protein